MPQNRIIITPKPQNKFVSKNLTARSQQPVTYNDSNTTYSSASVQYSTNPAVQGGVPQVLQINTPLPKNNKIINQ